MSPSHSSWGSAQIVPLYLASGEDSPRSVPPRHWWGYSVTLPAPTFALSPERPQASSAGATEVCPVFENRSKSRP